MTNHLKIMTFTFLLIFQISFGQERIIIGKVITDNLQPIPGVLIKSNSTVIDTTDLHGNFKFKFTKEFKNLEFIFLGMENEKVVIKENCNNIELIMLEQGTYCFDSLKAAERKMKRRRKKVLPKAYIEAYENGIFTNDKSCR